jgi:hypothetical protein
MGNRFADHAEAPSGLFISMPNFVRFYLPSIFGAPGALAHGMASASSPCFSDLDTADPPRGQTRMLGFHPTPVNVPVTNLCQIPPVPSLCAHLIFIYSLTN